MFVCPNQVIDSSVDSGGILERLYFPFPFRFPGFCLFRLCQSLFLNHGYRNRRGVSISTPLEQFTPKTESSRLHPYFPDLKTVRGSFTTNRVFCYHSSYDSRGSHRKKKQIPTKTRVFLCNIYTRPKESIREISYIKTKRDYNKVNMTKVQRIVQTM